MQPEYNADNIDHIPSTADQHSKSFSEIGAHDSFILCDSYYSTILIKKEYLNNDESLQLFIDNTLNIPIDLSTDNQQAALSAINQFWDSAFDTDARCWKSSQAALNLDFSRDWTLDQGHTAYLYQGSDQPNENIELVYHDPVIGEFLPVNPGEYYQIGGSFGCHRCDALFKVEFYTLEKEKIQHQKIKIASEQLRGGRKLENYNYIAESVCIPNAGAFVRIVLVKLSTQTGLSENHSFFFFTHLFFFLAPTSDCNLDWRNNPFSYDEWQRFRKIKHEQIVAVNLQLPKTILDGKDHLIEVRDTSSMSVLPGLSKSFCSQGSVYYWDRFRINLNRACTHKDWKAGAKLVLDWLDENPQDAQPGKLAIVCCADHHNTEQGIFKSASIEALQVARCLTELAPTEPCAWRWLIDISYQLQRWQECLNAYNSLAKHANLNETDDKYLADMRATVLEKAYRYEEAFHAFLQNRSNGFEQNLLDKLPQIVENCDNLQLSGDEIVWLCGLNRKKKSFSQLIAALVTRLSAQSLNALLNRLKEPYGLIAQALAKAVESAETTLDWSSVLTLLEALDNANMLDPLPDWVAVESLWMSVQFERLALTDKAAKDKYSKNLARLKGFPFWKQAVSFDQNCPLPDQNYLQYRQTWVCPPKTAITRLSGFLAQPDSFNITPHILFSIGWYKNIAQLENNSVHPLVHFFRYSNGYTKKSLNPNPYFDCAWYRHHYLQNNAINHPLLHYLAHFQEAAIQPSQLFSNDYIRETQGLLVNEDPLAYYLEQIDSKGVDFCLEGFSPSPFFDRAFYLQHNKKLRKKISENKFDLFVHYIERGQAKGRQAYPWQRYNEFVRHQRLYLELHNQYSPFGSEDKLGYIKGEKAEAIYLAGQRVLATQLAYQPLISILVPVFQVKPQFLRDMIESVLAQTYSHWQLCLVDDASKRHQQDIIALLKQYSSQDQRIIYSTREQNGHICATSNDCLKLAQGEYIALLDHDDLLTPDALYEMAAAINLNPDLDIIYSDEDKVDEWGMFFAPYYKPDWSPHSLWSRMYTCHLTVYRKSLVNDAGGFRVGFEGSQDYDLMLRCSEKTTHIHHIARVLYHWRSHSESTAGAEDAKGYSVDAGYKALQEALLRRGLVATVHPVGISRTAYWVKPEIIGSPSVDIIIPSRNGSELLATCLNSVFNKTSYAYFKVTVIDNNSDEKSFFELIEYWSEQEPDRFQVIRDENPFNFSAINNLAVQKTAGDYVLFLNNDTEVINKDWLHGMLSYAQLEEVGAVGVKLLYPDDTVQHAGVATGLGGVAGHVMKHAQRDSPGYFWNLKLVTDYSVVTAACLMVSRKKFHAVNGLTEYLQVAFNDVDFCLKLRKHGLYNVYLPFVELYHYESKSRGYEDTDEKRERFEKEILFMRQCWGKALDNDPFYSPWLTLADETMGYRFH